MADVLKLISGLKNELARVELGQSIIEGEMERAPGESPELPDMLSAVQAERRALIEAISKLSN
jgi:hypothetical protein